MSIWKEQLDKHKKSVLYLFIPRSSYVLYDVSYLSLSYYVPKTLCYNF
jgi:hypothetical protein